MRIKILFFRRKKKFIKFAVQLRHRRVTFFILFPLNEFFYYLSSHFSIFLNEMIKLNCYHECNYRRTFFSPKECSTSDMQSSWLIGELSTIACAKWARTNRTVFSVKLFIAADLKSPEKSKKLERFQSVQENSTKLKDIRKCAR